MTIRFPQKQGFSLLELTIVLIMGTLLITLVVILANHWIKEQRISRETQTLQLMVEKLKDYSTSSTTTAAINTNLAIAIGAVPQGSYLGTTEIMNAFGSHVTVSPGNLNGINNNAILISYRTLNARECINIVNNSAFTFDKIIVGNAGGAPPPAQVVQDLSIFPSSPLDTRSLVRYCTASNPDARTSSIDFLFKKG